MLSACVSKKDPLVQTIDNGMSYMNAAIEHDENFGKAASMCHSQRDLPVLYAHYLELAVKDEMCTEESSDRSFGAINCAPGPMFLDHGNSVDRGDRDWILPSLPDYFAWRIGHQGSIDEEIYIANADGRPIISQTSRLENGHDATLVLIPKTSLTPDSRYYLYLVSTLPNAEKKRWIQPIVVSAGK